MGKQRGDPSFSPRRPVSARRTSHRPESGRREPPWGPSILSSCFPTPHAPSAPVPESQSPQTPQPCTSTPLPNFPHPGTRRGGLACGGAAPSSGRTVACTRAELLIHSPPGEERAGFRGHLLSWASGQWRERPWANVPGSLDMGEAAPSDPGRRIMPRLQAPAGPGAHLTGQTWLSSGHARPALAPVTTAPSGAGRLPEATS